MAAIGIGSWTCSARFGVRSGSRAPRPSPHTRHYKYGRDLVGGGAQRQARSGDRPRRRDPPVSTFCPARRRTTRCLSVTQAWARPPSSRAWRSGLSAATCQRGSRTRRCSRWTWARSSRAPSSGRVRGAAEGSVAGDQGRRRQILLFIDELHTVVGAGEAGGSMDAGNLLKPMLARGELHCIGATTLDEYRKHIEKDAALSGASSRCWSTSRRSRTRSRSCGGCGSATSSPRRAHPGRRARRGGACRPLHLRPLPAGQGDRPRRRGCAVIRTEIDSMPQELDELTRRVLQLEIQEAALSKEKDDASKQRLEALRKELADLRAEADAHASAVGGRAPGDPQAAGAARELEQVRRRSRMPSALRPNRAAELRHGRLPELERRLRGGGGAAGEKAGRDARCCARRSPRTRSRDRRALAGYRWPGWSRASGRSSCGSTRPCTSG